MDVKKVDPVVVDDKKPAEVPPAPEVKKEVERDYKAESEALKKELGQAQHTIITLKGKKKEEEPAPVAAGEEVPVAAPAVASDVDEKLENFKLEQAKDFIEEELESLSENPDKRELIKLHYEKRIVRTGFDRKSIKADLADALAIVDKPRNEKTINELKQTSISNRTRNTSGSAAGQDIGGDSGEMKEEQLTPKDKQVMARHGLTLKDINKK